MDLMRSRPRTLLVPAALSHAIGRVLVETELRTQLSAGCAVVTSRLGWAEPVRDMEALYAELASKQVAGAESRRAG